MRIGVPVVCQNGHPSTWVIEIVDLNGIDRGATDSCSCPKWGAEQGWRPSGGEPFVMTTTANAVGTSKASEPRAVLPIGGGGGSLQPQEAASVPTETDPTTNSHRRDP